jgi:hypothetical protein
VLPSIDTIRRMNSRDLSDLVESSGNLLDEAAAIAVLENRYSNDSVCDAIAQNIRLSALRSVRLRLVAHRATPQTHAVKLLHYLAWTDLLRLSVDVRVSPMVRHAMDRLLMARVSKQAVGERISIGRRCSREVAMVLLYDPTPRVFASVLINPRLREDDIVALITSQRVTPEQLQMIGNDRKWSLRYAVRLGLVLNSSTPRAVAASQLRYLRRRDLLLLGTSERISVYLLRCIESQLRSVGEDGSE